MKLMSTCIPAICLSVMFATANSLFASGDNYAFTYQAALRDEHGAVLQQRNQQVRIRLYTTPTGGNALWGRLYSVYTDATGLFNLEVSDNAGSAIDGLPNTTLQNILGNNEAGSLYIGVEVVGSAGEIVPRQRLFAVPFASVANDVRAIGHDVTVSGNITVGNSSSGVVITPVGIQQKSGTGSFVNLTASGNASVAGQVSAAGGLTVTGGKTEFKNNVEIKSGNTLTVGGSEVVPVPVGGIIMWTSPTLPDNTHWAVCDGQNGTPDLRSRFIVGVDPRDSDYNSSGRTGGDKSVTLSEYQMPKHRHYYAGDDQLAGIEGSDDSYDRYCTEVVYDTDSPYDASSSRGSGNSHVYKTSAKGSGGAHENRPPYYSLYFIKRIR